MGLCTSLIVAAAALEGEEKENIARVVCCWLPLGRRGKKKSFSLPIVPSDFLLCSWIDDAHRLLLLKRVVVGWLTLWVFV